MAQLMQLERLFLLLVVQVTRYLCRWRLVWFFSNYMLVCGYWLRIRCMYVGFGEREERGRIKSGVCFHGVSMYHIKSCTPESIKTLIGQTNAILTCT